MTDASADRIPSGQPPGDTLAPRDSQVGPFSPLLVYTAGLVLAVGLTLTSFWVANTGLIWAPGVPLGLAVLAVAQMGVHLVFFLHITTGPDNTNNVLALAFGLMIVVTIVAGSLWIMTNLNERMIMPAEMMDLHLQR